MEMYDRVAKVVAPKKAKLALAQAALEETQNQLATKTEELRILNERLAKLKTNLELSVNKKENLQNQVGIFL